MLHELDAQDCISVSGGNTTEFISDETGMYAVTFDDNGAYVSEVKLTSDGDDWYYTDVQNLTPTSNWSDLTWEEWFCAAGAYTMSEDYVYVDEVCDTNFEGMTDEQRNAHLSEEALKKMGDILPKSYVN